MSVHVTRVGRAEDGDNRFRGRSVAHDLAGSFGLAQTIILALTGRTLSADDALLVDDLVVSILAADPRIWPLRVPRVAASDGSPFVGAAAALLAQESTAVGGGSSGVAAAYFARVASELGSAVDDDAAVSAVVQRDYASGHKFVGYGVPFRDTDERVTTAEACLVRRGRGPGVHWRLARRIERALAVQRSMPLNAAGMMAAALLDLGLQPDEIGWVVVVLSLPSLLANATEAAEQRSAFFRRFPDEALDYVGPKPRRSPRYRER